MAHKSKNVASGSGTKRGRKGEAAKSSSRATNNLPPQKFGERALMPYGKDWYGCQQESKYLGDEHLGEISVEALNEFLGTPNCDDADFLAMIERPPYRDIRHTLCGVNSVVRWDRVRDMGRHLTLHYGHFNLEARIWLKIMCSTLLLCKHTTDVTRERVVLIYHLMKGLPVNVGAILKQNMLKFRTNKRWHFCYGRIITRYLHALQIEEEVHDLSPPRAPHLVCRLVDVIRTKMHDSSQGPVLTAIDRQAHDDSWMGRMFGMPELQLWIGGHPVIEDEMETLAERYPLTDSTMYMYQMRPAFQEPIDDNDATADKEDGSEKDKSYDTGPGDDDIDADDRDANATLMAMDFATNDSEGSDRVKEEKELTNDE
ncbi:hypothetical protein H5410_013228 [Solanum commersonii]|uniref:Putative plant transposon protein domain-containing protein n=1 Tax=Solanum commersonii TaxID=4109 RepID=A0A9J6AUV0_SOLCO|nr:hypothetical protein H5410_013228 [Solanum commersonii]